MSEYLIQGASMTAIADAIRAKANTTDSMTPEAMATAVAGLKTGLDELYDTPVVSEIKTGTFTVSSDSVYGPTLTLWPGGTAYDLGICFMVYTKTTNWRTTGDPPGIVSSLDIEDGDGIKYASMNGSILIGRFGKATHGYYNSGDSQSPNYDVVLITESKDAGTFRPRTHRQDAAVFKAGAVYEWTAWRNK